MKIIVMSGWGGVKTDVAVSPGAAADGTVTFGRGGQPVASRCSCSEVWLQERRSEQHAVRPSLFIREEMMLQPQPHIDVLISSPAAFSGGRTCGGEKRRKKGRKKDLL